MNIDLRPHGSANANLERHPSAGKPILHWFSGTAKELQRAVEMGCWFSVGPAMVAGAKGRDLVSRMPIEKLLPETDGSFATVNRNILMPWQATDIID
ncbi:TatD family hydrolase [Cupriavidus sp. 8B]